MVAILEGIADVHAAEAHVLTSGIAYTNCLAAGLYVVTCWGQKAALGTCLLCRLMPWSTAQDTLWSS